MHRRVSGAYLILDMYDQGEFSICCFAIDIVFLHVLNKDLTELPNFRGYGLQRIAYQSQLCP